MNIKSLKTWLLPAALLLTTVYQCNRANTESKRADTEEFKKLELLRENTLLKEQLDTTNNSKEDINTKFINCTSNLERQSTVFNDREISLELKNKELKNSNKILKDSLQSLNNLFIVFSDTINDLKFALRISKERESDLMEDLLAKDKTISRLQLYLFSENVGGSLNANPDTIFMNLDELVSLGNIAEKKDSILSDILLKGINSQVTPSNNGVSLDSLTLTINANDFFSILSEKSIIEERREYILSRLEELFGVSLSTDFTTEEINRALKNTLDRDFNSIFPPVQNTNESVIRLDTTFNRYGNRPTRD